MDLIKLFSLFLIFLFLLSCSKDSNDHIEEINVQELQFTFEDSTYIVTDPIVTKGLYTRDYDIIEPIDLFVEYVSIRAKINEHQKISATVYNSLVEPSNCIPEMIYYEQFNEAQCLYFTLKDEPLNTNFYRFCNHAIITLHTIINDTTSVVSFSQTGYIEILECDNNSISGSFESDHYSEGTFKNLIIE